MRSVPLAGIIQGPEEIAAVNNVLNGPWHTEGLCAQKLEQELADYFGTKYAVVVNSGSSANLLALQSLNLPRRSKVLTSACSFPATINPILHLNMRPILVDYDIRTLNINLTKLHEIAVTHYRTYESSLGIQAMILAHTMGSSLDMDYIMYVAQKYNIKVIEDCCEAVGTKYNNRCVGSFGDVGTISFYPSHQINGMGMGGALLTSNQDIYERAKSLKSWGKKNIRIGEQYTKFSSEVDGIPYDEQYTYTTIGYNMRLPDANCAYVSEQLKRLPGFIEKRQENYTYLDSLLADLPLFRMQYPKEASPAFFGYPIVLKEEGKRDALVEHMEKNGIHVRLFFSGNILRHEPYKDIQYESDNKPFYVADYLMKNAFFCGCWPGLGKEDMEYISGVIHDFFNLAKHSM